MSDDYDSEDDSDEIQSTSLESLKKIKAPQGPPVISFATAQVIKAQSPKNNSYTDK